MKNLNLFIPITKVDEEKRLVYGIATAEQPDQSGEICDYETTKPYYEKWSAGIEKATEGKSKGNLRVMHNSKVAGTIPQILFNDAEKQIEICAKVVDNDEWKMVLAGGYTGFSQGGKYIKTWKDGDYTRYTAAPTEVSLVDNPCLPSATFTLLRASGAEEMRKFKLKGNDMAKKEIKQVWLAADGSTFDTKADAIKKTAELEAAELAKVNDAIGEIDTLLTAAEGKQDGATEEVGGEAEKEIESVGTPGAQEAAQEAGEVNVNAEAGSAEKAALPKFKKGLFEVSRLASLLMELSWIEGCVEDEAAREEDGSAVPGKLTAAIRSLGESLKEMCAEEVDELLGSEGAEMAMSAKIERLAKKGASISSASKSHIDAMHKSATDHMATIDKCYKALGVDDKDSGDKDGDDDAQKMAKINAENELVKSLTEKNELLAKQVSESNETITKFAERLKRLELQPAAPKGTLYHVEKGHELNSGSAVEANNDFLMSSRISPEEFRRQINR